jgi:hypothetical protein
VIDAALIAAAAALAPAYAGRTDEGRRVAVATSGRRVTRVVGTVVDYECERFGRIGPLRVSVRARARPDRRGRFSFVAGERAERVGVAGTFQANGTITGRVRVSGTIATGERCVSPIVRFRARER